MGRPSKKQTPSSFRDAFIERTRIARKFFSEQPGDMAKALGIKQGTYTRYETRNMLPHRYIPRFIELTGVPYDWFMSGKRSATSVGISPPSPDLE